MPLSRIALMASFVACAHAQEVTVTATEEPPLGGITIRYPSTGSLFASKLAPTTELRHTTMFDGSRAWAELNPDLQNPVSQMWDVSDEHLNLYIEMSETVEMVAGTTAEYECQNTLTGCQAYVFIFQCFPCDFVDGGLARSLVNEGFTRTRCAPTFTTEIGGPRYKMSSFVRHIEPNTNYTVAVPGNARYVIFGIDVFRSTNCQAQDAYSCLNGHNCALTATSCNYRTCTQMLPMPGAPGCAECPPAYP